MTDDPRPARTLDEVIAEGEAGNLSDYARRVKADMDAREAMQTPEEVLEARMAALAEFRDIAAGWPEYVDGWPTPAKQAADASRRLARATKDNRSAAAEKRAGPTPITDLPTVLASQARLRERGVPAGERSVALDLGVSRDAVRYALGKDRKRPG